MVSPLRILWLALFCWIVMPGSSMAATITASVDRNPVAAMESFQLMFNVQGELDDEPDFSPLETYFDIISQNQSNRIQIINGQMDRTHQWVLTLMATQAGNYTLPAIAFGNDRSNPISLTVKAASTDLNDETGPLFLETEVHPEKAYVQGQVLYTVRLYRSVNLRSGTLSEPKVSGLEAIIEKLGEDQSYETQRNGVRYIVVERRYALFPQQSGTLTLEPTVFQGQILEASRFAFNDVVKTRRIASQGHEITVAPIPANAGKPWLPSTEVKLVEEWPSDPPEFHVGEPLTRTLTLMAQGISSAQLPSLSRELADGLKRYPDQPLLKDDIQEQGLLGIRQEKVAIMPTRPGRYTLPAIEIPWWNLRTGKAEVARLPQRTIEVMASPGNPADEGTSQQTIESQRETPAQTTTPVAGTGDHEAPAARKVVNAGYWPWISMLLALGWAITAILWWRQHRWQTTTPLHRRTNSVSAIKNACGKRDAHACKRALLAWAGQQWPQHPPTSLQTLAQQVDGEFSTAIQDLNRVLYAEQNHEWNGDALLRALQHWRKHAHHASATRPVDIAHLHPVRENTQ